MFCYECGGALPVSARFCGRCGTRVSPPTLQPDPVLGAEVFDAEPPPIAVAPIPLSKVGTAPPVTKPPGVEESVSDVPVPTFIQPAKRHLSWMWAVLGTVTVVVVAGLILFVLALARAKTGGTGGLPWDTADKKPSSSAPFVTTGLPVLPAGYRYLTESGPEIDLLPYVLPEREEGGRRRYVFLDFGGGRLTIQVTASETDPSSWHVSADLPKKSGTQSLPADIRVSGEWLLSVNGGMYILHDSAPKLLKSGSWEQVRQSSQQKEYEKTVGQVTDDRVAIVAESDTKLKDGRPEAVVLIWCLSARRRDSGKVVTFYALSEFTEGKGNTKVWVGGSEKPEWVLDAQLESWERNGAAESEELRPTPSPVLQQPGDESARAMEGNSDVASQPTEKSVASEANAKMAVVDGTAQTTADGERLRTSEVSPNEPYRATLTCSLFGKSVAVLACVEGDIKLAGEGTVGENNKRAMYALKDSPQAVTFELRQFSTIAARDTLEGSELVLTVTEGRSSGKKIYEQKARNGETVSYGRAAAPR